MTIAVAIKINDGIVLGTDSATAIYIEVEDNKRQVAHTFYNADKLFNLKKGCPIGCLTWGDGQIKEVSISAIVKDFRNTLTSSMKNISKIVEGFKSFLKKRIGESSEKVNVSFLITGFSEETTKPEMYVFNIIDGEIQETQEINQDEPFAISWFGESDYLTRFLLSFDPQLPELLKEHDFNEENIENIMKICQENLSLPLGAPSMPVNDAIDLVKFLIDFSQKASYFMPGPQIIGGPIDIAVITKHEDFKWINRKYYYDQKINI